MRRTRCVIGIIGTILLLVGIGSEILENRTAKSLFTNHDLLQQLGRNPADFAEMPERLDAELVFHVLGGMILSGYLLAVLLKRRKGAFVLLCLTVLYFLVLRLNSAFSLNEEEQIRGLTVGAWLLKVGVELVPFAIEMAIVSQGWVALRPHQNRRTSEEASSPKMATAPKGD